MMAKDKGVVAIIVGRKKVASEPTKAHKRYTVSSFSVTDFNHHRTQCTNEKHGKK